MTSVRILQGIFIALVFLGPVAACLPRPRAWLAAHPRSILIAMLGVDLAYMLWATVPFIPAGVDESYLAINALVYGGSDLYVAWMRPPLPGLGAALFPAHPPLPGLLMKTLAAVFVYKLAKRSMGTRWALLAVWLCLTSSRLSNYSSSMLSEPYGAAALAAFTYGAARGLGGATGGLAALAFLCRWPLGYLWPIATLLGFRKARFGGALLATVLFVVPSALVIWLTGAKPWELIGGRSSGYWHKPPWETFMYFVSPKVGAGLGLVGMLVATLGAWATIRTKDRSPELTWCLALFATNFLLLTIMGEAVARFFAPTAPLGCVLVVAGLKAARDRGPGWLGSRFLPGLLAGAVAAAMCIPVKPPKLRMQRLESPQSLVREHRSHLRILLNGEPLYSDVQFLALTAILDQPVHAVTHDPNDTDRYHPWGVSMDWEGKFPDCPRGDVPKDALYLTYDPSDREVLWYARDLYLVRW